MLYSQDFLKQCEELANLSKKEEFQPGDRISRGFADFGFEEFYYTGNNKIVSILTAKQSEIPKEHLEFFFLIPDSNSILNRIIDNNFDIIKLEFIDNREWYLKIKKKSLEFEYEESLLDDLLINALIDTLKIENE